MANYASVTALVLKPPSGAGAAYLDRKVVPVLVGLWLDDYLASVASHELSKPKRPDFHTCSTSKVNA
jgi:hypothetical protein